MIEDKYEDAGAALLIGLVTFCIGVAYLSRAAYGFLLFGTVNMAYAFLRLYLGVRK